jgi:hypothetical protein
MFCPQCGTSQGEELKFCKSCGANLYAVRQVVTSRDTGEKFDWNKTWVAEMLLSPDEQKKRKHVRDHNIGPEEKRYNEIKAGIITSCVGIGAMIFLYVLMQGIILSGQNPPQDAAILSRIWVAGVIPFFVGLALVFNGLVVSKRLLEHAQREQQGRDTSRSLDSTAKGNEGLSLSPAEWYESGSSKPSVTENTTRQLGDTSQRQ